ncbi:hypothetical protein LCGC14_1140900 [marine sediment metagenome]|uniref:Uncharacterized protein n=1 Tax=marine sediment metagenome TaxID=412755 RepID=A0A0F9PGG6_9ZZZZ
MKNHGQRIDKCLESGRERFSEREISFLKCLRESAYLTDAHMSWVGELYNELMREPHTEWGADTIEATFEGRVEIVCESCGKCISSQRVLSRRDIDEMEEMRPDDPRSDLRRWALAIFAGIGHQLRKGRWSRENDSYFCGECKMKRLEATLREGAL